MEGALALAGDPKATTPSPFNIDAANDLLAAFDVADDPQSRAFLADLLASGTVPPEEVELLAGIDGGGGRKAARRRAKSTSASASGSASSSPSKRQRKQGPRKGRGTHRKKDGKKRENRLERDPFSGRLKTSVSPFFADDAPTSTDDSDEDDEEERGYGVTGEEKERDDKLKGGPVDAVQRQPSLPPPTFTRTVVVHTRRTVVGGNADRPPQTTKTATPSKQIELPKAANSKRSTSQTPSPTKTLKSEPRSPSPACFSCVPSPSLSTPKRKRETTSYFFTPPSSRHGRRQKDDGSSCSEDDSLSDSPSPSPVPPPKEKEKKRLSRPRRGTVSALPFPRLDAPHFGLVQEKLATEPFWLLIALVFLTRVAGRISLPVFWALKTRFPSPQALVDADPRDLVATMRHLGMATVRCAAIQRYARRWLQRPPQPGVCTTVKNYPTPAEGYRGEECEQQPPRFPHDSQWEIGHLTQGAYAVDSWRIFCRDGLLGRSTDWKGDAGGCMAGKDSEEEESTEEEEEESDWDTSWKVRPRADEPFQPEWMRVLPRDKELRACLRWMWMREGWDWDPRTGERTVLSEALRQAVDEGRVAYDAKGQMQIVEGEGNKERKRERLEVVL